MSVSQRLGSLINKDEEKGIMARKECLHLPLFFTSPLCKKKAEAQEVTTTSASQISSGLGSSKTPNSFVLEMERASL